jgi:hypothetical protein
MTIKLFWATRTYAQFSLNCGRMHHLETRRGKPFASFFVLIGMLNFECVFACILFMHSYRCHPHNTAPQGN